MKRILSCPTWMVTGLTIAFLVAACGSSKKDTSTNTDDGAGTTVASGGVASTGASQPGAIPSLLSAVKATVPTGLKSAGSSLALTDTGLSGDEFKSRFFSGEGPTDVFTIIQHVDDRLADVNQQIAQTNQTCMSLTPAPYTLSFSGQEVTLYAQCYEKISQAAAGDPAFLQFGKKDGVTYIYSAVGMERVAAIVTPVTGTTDQYTVQLWIGVGYFNDTGCSTNGSFDGCSYGVIALSADESTKTFEMAVAGIGFGYCGAQLKSDGSWVYGIGSADDPGLSCGAPATLCVAASDLTATGTCDALTTFSLPALGRAATTGSQSWEASQYPATPNVTLDGTDSDSLYFGPLVPTAGAQQL